MVVGFTFVYIVKNKEQAFNLSTKGEVFSLFIG